MYTISRALSIPFSPGKWLDEMVSFPYKIVYHVTKIDTGSDSGISQNIRVHMYPHIIIKSQINDLNPIDGEWRIDHSIINVAMYYSYVTMSAMTSQITGIWTVCSIVCSGAHQRKKTSAPLHWPLRGECSGNRWIPLTKGQYHRECFHLITSSCDWYR